MITDGELQDHAAVHRPVLELHEVGRRGLRGGGVLGKRGGLDRQRRGGQEAGDESSDGVASLHDRVIFARTGGLGDRLDRSPGASPADEPVQSPRVANRASRAELFGTSGSHGSTSTDAVKGPANQGPTKPWAYTASR